MHATWTSFSRMVCLLTSYLYYVVQFSGNGILDAMELAAGLARLGVDVGNNSMVLAMMMEAGAKLQHAYAARMLTCTHTHTHTHTHTISIHNEHTEMPMYL